MRNIIAVILVIAFFSCGRMADLKPVALKDSSVTKGDSLKDIAFILSIDTVHFFSNTAAPDSFNITLRGPSVLGGWIKFSITGSKGQLIHEEFFPANDMLWDDDEAIIGYQAKSDTIIARIERFFYAGSFIQPATRIAENFDPDNSDKNTWEEIKATPGAVGFIYSHGYEGTYAIAYSRSRKKAVTYYSSD